MKYVLSIGLLIFVVNCSPTEFEASINTNSALDAESIPVDDGTTPAPVAKPLEVVLKYKGNTWMNLDFIDYKITEYPMSVVPSWEVGAPSQWKVQSENYTQYAAFILDHFAPNMINGPHFLTSGHSLCPKYNSLNRRERIEFWVHFISAVTKYESGYKPNMRYFESTFGYKDSVTQEPVYSEGLLQLSYQDGKSYKECSPAFSWSQDKLLPRTSLEKTIFDPMRNLYCGISIMNRLITKKKTLFYDTGHYWAVLKPSGKYGKVPLITQSVQANNPKCK
jgi:hypothetical protein